MASATQKDLDICEVAQDVLDKYRKFRFRRKENPAAMILKIDPKERKIVIDEEIEDQLLDDLQYELPDQSPRYVLYQFTHTHPDGRKSVPLVFIFLSPAGGKLEMNLMYSGSMAKLVQKLEVTKIFEVRSVEELTQEWLRDKLAFFD